MQLPGRVPRDDDVPTLEGYDKRVDTKPSLVIEPEPSRLLKKIRHPNRRPRRRRTSRKFGGAGPRRGVPLRPSTPVAARALRPEGHAAGAPACATRCDLHAVAARRDGVPSTPTPSAKAAADERELATASPRAQAEDERRRQAKEAEDEALYGPRYSEIMDGNRRIQKDREDRAKGGLAHETGGVPVECVPCSPRQVPDLVAQKAGSWQAPPENSEEKRLKFRKTFNERLRERSIICKTCGQTYTEAHNSAFACGYHPGVYRVACPVTCPAHKDVKRIARVAWATGGKSGRVAIACSKAKPWVGRRAASIGTICLLARTEVRRISQNVAGRHPNGKAARCTDRGEPVE